MLPPALSAPPTFRGLRAAVLGFGIEGRDAAVFLQREGVSQLQIIDHRPVEQLEAETAALQLEPTAISSPDDLCLLNNLDVIVASQGIPRGLPLLAAADARTIPVFGPIGVFLDRSPAPVIGISGSAGKTTTTMLLGEMLSADGRDPFVGGNLGRGLLAHLPELKFDSSVLIEISHTQLLRASRSPQLAALLNVTPNHLDAFSWAEYVELKRRLVSQQSTGDHAVFPWDEPNAAAMAAETPARVSWFGDSGAPPAGADAAWLENGELLQRSGCIEQRVLAASELRIPGAHNVRNALAAVALAAPLGVPLETAANVLSRFEGVAHRLETVGLFGGVRYINDSIATAPERTLAGIRAVGQPLVLLLGGRDKQLPLDRLLAALPDRVRAVVCFGELGPAWIGPLQRTGLQCSPPCETLDDAFAAARALARPGDAVLLSPGGASFDAYPNFEARGDHFRALAEALNGDQREGSA